MNKIRVTTDVLRNYARQMNECADALSDAKSDLQNIINSLPECCAEVGAKEKLESWVRATDASSSNCAKTGSGLNSAAQGFESCETEIARSIDAITRSREHEGGTVTTTAVAGTATHAQSGQTTTTDGRNIFEKARDWIADKADEVLDWMNINEYGRDYEDPGREREEAHEQQMREEIEEIFRDEALNEEAWNNADNEGKREIQREVLKRLNQIFGTNVIESIWFFNDEGSGLMGQYTNEFNFVRVNEAHYDDGYEAMMNNIVHEMRHAYQRKAAYKPEECEVSQETSETWRDNWKNYRSTIDVKPISEWTEPFEVYSVEEYRDQPVEADAREFADSIDYGASDD